MPRLHHLDPHSEKILRSAIAAIRPRGHGFDQPIDDDVAIEIDATLPFLPAPLRLGFPIGLRLLEWGSVAASPARRRLTRLSREDAERYLERWLESPFPPFRNLLLGIRALVFLAFYQHPDVLRAMGVDWQGRVLVTTARRVRALEEEPDVLRG